TAVWWPALQGLAISSETRTDVAGSLPNSKVPVSVSTEIVARILNSITFTKRNSRLQRIATVSLVILVLLLGAAMMAGRQARINRQEAQAEAQKRDVAQSEAREKTDAAQQAEKLRDQAFSDRDFAQHQAKEEARQAQQSELQRARAELFRDAARAEANKQQEIAKIRRLANESEFTRGQGSDLLVQSVALATEATKRADDLGMQIVEADSA